MAPNTVQDFRNLYFHPSNSENFLRVSDSSDPYVNFFNSVPKEHIKYFTADNITVELHSSEKDAPSILYFNMRSLNKNFEILKVLSAELCFGFQMICLTESWCSADGDNENIFGLPGYPKVHQVRNHGQGGRGDLYLPSQLFNL